MTRTGTKVDNLTTELRTSVDNLTGAIRQTQQAANQAQQAADDARQAVIDHRQDITRGQDRKFGELAQGLEKIRNTIEALQQQPAEDPEPLESQGGSDTVTDESRDQEHPDPLAELRTEMLAKIAELHEAINSSTAQEDEVNPLEDVRALHVLKREAASTSSATLIAHQDTWAFVVEQAMGHKFFSIPGRVVGGVDNPRVEVEVSGPSLLAIVSSLHDTIREGADEDVKAMAEGVYRKVALGLEGLKPGVGKPDSNGGQWTRRRPRIVIDDLVDQPEE